MGLLQIYKDAIAKASARQETKNGAPEVMTVPLSNINFKLPKEYRQQFATQYMFTNSLNEHCYVVFDRFTGLQTPTLHMKNNKSVIIHAPEKEIMQ